MVAHNIEDAVLMSDGIVVFLSNPGHMVAELPVNLPWPRNRTDSEFRKLVDDIYPHDQNARRKTAAGRSLGPVHAPRGTTRGPAVSLSGIACFHPMPILSRRRVA
jgi:hypothetical protein